MDFFGLNCADIPKNKTKQNKKNHLKSETLLVSNILDKR
jgi:hypothetical protein